LSRGPQGRLKNSLSPWERARGEGRTRAILFLVLLLLLAPLSCGDSASRIARRILDHHRTSARAKPLPAAQVILLKLSAPEGPATGETEIAWEGAEYREKVSSADVATIRGIQAGKAYYSDEDGVTRVASEPVLRELLTRFYFWKRAYLFKDLERASIRLGPADDSTVSVELLPRGGNPLLLRFSRSDHLLTAVRSPRFNLDFRSPVSIRDFSRAGTSVSAAIAWIGLPTGPLPDATVGPWSSRFAQPSVEASLTSDPEDILFPATLGGVTVRLRLDAVRAGPVLLSPETAAASGAAFRRDVFGRDLGGRVPLAIGALSYPGVHVERSASPLGGADAIAGGTLLRETIVELDPAARRIRFHDPAVWPTPEGFVRIIIDDDGNLPVATLGRTTRRARVAVGSAPGSVLLLAPESAMRMGLPPKATSVQDLGWGPLNLSEMPVSRVPGRFSPDWGDDGELPAGVLLRYRVFVDMHHRWIYLKPLMAPGSRRSARGARE